jgi:hypothetical protein
LRYSVVLALALGSWPLAADAFDNPSQFFVVPGVPHTASFGASAEGVYFTGAPRFAGQTCVNCHIGGPQLVGLKLGADATLLSDGYQPGKTYELEVTLTNEHAGTSFSTSTCTEPPGPKTSYAYVPCNNNSFALEVDSGGAPLASASQFCPTQPSGAGCAKANPATDEVAVSPDGDAVFGNRQHDPQKPYLVSRNDPTSWHLWWTAPSAGTGPVTLYVAAVDGNGGGSGDAANDQDPFGDDTVAASFFIAEAGMPTDLGAQVGCALGGSGAMARALAAPAACLFLIVAFVRRRRRY